MPAAPSNPPPGASKDTGRTARGGAPAKSALPEAYWITNARGGKGGGNGGGGKGGGNGGGGGDGSGARSGRPPGERTFDQDDIVGALLALLLLLFGAWMFWNGRAAPDEGDPIVQPQRVASAPAPTPAPLVDPFGPGPVDLRPTSALPVPVEAPPVTIAAAALAPEPARSAPAATSCRPGLLVKAYFCTASFDLPAEKLAQLDAQIAELKACAGQEEIVVSGYADRRGPEVFNAYLSEQRASRLADLLRARGLKVADVSGFGELPDIEDNVNCANQRRADVSLKSSLAPPSRSCAPPEEAAKLTCV
ncbi:MAG: OmpA family protein [Alphaproteobacteria bacterium]|nr:OmpA family protein [Alphaproteobacteria bacterium]